MHVVENPMCPCSFRIENAKHFFLDCPLYSVERVKLVSDISQITETTISVILFGKEQLSYDDNVKIFQAVHEFIENSGRFNI